MPARRRPLAARPRPGPGFKETAFEVADINYAGLGGMRRSRRVVDPQAPVYVVHDMVIADEAVLLLRRRQSQQPRQGGADGATAGGGDGSK